MTEHSLLLLLQEMQFIFSMLKVTCMNLCGILSRKALTSPQTSFQNYESNLVQIFQSVVKSRFQLIHTLLFSDQFSFLQLQAV